MQESTVKWFDAKKGYGFINHPSGGDDVFVHYSQIISTKDFKTLRTGQEVEFDLNDGPKGVHALDVTPLDEEGEGTKKADDEKSDPSEGGASSANASSTTDASSATVSSTGPQPESETAGDDSTEEESDWEWDEEWTDEHGNPPDPMASPTF